MSEDLIFSIQGMQRNPRITAFMYYAKLSSHLTLSTIQFADEYPSLVQRLRLKHFTSARVVHDHLPASRPVRRNCIRLQVVRADNSG